MILQYQKTLSMISMVVSQCPISCVSETSHAGLVSCAFLTIPFQFIELLSALFNMLLEGSIQTELPKYVDHVGHQVHMCALVQKQAGRQTPGMGAEYNSSC